MKIVVGLGVTGEAVARRLAAPGETIVVVEDRPGGDAYEARKAALRRRGVAVAEAPNRDDLERLVASAELVVPSPGVPESHPVYRLAAAAGVPILSEIELAATAAAQLGRLLVAVTGTNGKTTVTTLITEMLVAGGLSAIAAGNIGRPLLDAVHDDVEVVVAEVSSFQLRFTDRFRPRVAVFLNAADDHLDWHPTFLDYVEAKARIFARQAGGDLLIYNADDRAVAAVAQGAPARTVGFSLDTDVRDAQLFLPGSGEPLLGVGDLPRAAPHDLANALASAAAASEIGVPAQAICQVLAGFSGLPHRTTLVGQSGGVTFVDDSKATNPHAALAAIDGYDSVVLLAGGRNKGLDLGVLASRAGRIRAVVAIGESAGEVAAAFSGVRPVRAAASMADAVKAAVDLAEPGDTVLLSPACASFDWYRSYSERGDDFAARVREVIG